MNTSRWNVRVLAFATSVAVLPALQTSASFATETQECPTPISTATATTILGTPTVHSTNCAQKNFKEPYGPYTAFRWAEAETSGWLYSYTNQATGQGQRTYVGVSTHIDERYPKRKMLDGKTVYRSSRWIITRHGKTLPQYDVVYSPDGTVRTAPTVIVVQDAPTRTSAVKLANSQKT